MLKFLGKTKIPHRKNTADLAPVRMTAPSEVCITMDQHLGAPATPIVKVGDEVKVGQPIAEASSYISAPIFASVSGKITKIDSVLRANGANVTAVWIESDNTMTPYEGITPPVISDVDSLINAVRDCGMVGLGGAGFPTAVKLEAVKKGVVDTVIINAAECEPYLTSDARTMLDDSEYVFEGISLLQKIIPDIKRYIIGIESNKPKCIAEMKRIFADNEAVNVVCQTPCNRRRCKCCKAPLALSSGCRKDTHKKHHGTYSSRGKASRRRRCYSYERNYPRISRKVLQDRYASC